MVNLSTSVPNSKRFESVSNYFENVEYLGLAATSSDDIMISQQRVGWKRNDHTLTTVERSAHTSVTTVWNPGIFSEISVLSTLGGLSHLKQDKMIENGFH